MFWNSEFLSVSSRQDELLSQSTKLSDILFEDELLQELKTSNMIWVNFLIRPEIMRELVDNITQLTEKDCFDKLLYSRIHAAYISCEILTAGSSEIFSALMQSSEYLNKILECLIYEPDLSHTEQASNSEPTLSVANNARGQSEPLVQAQSEKTDQELLLDKQHHPSDDDEQAKTQSPDQQETNVNQHDHQVPAQNKVHKVVPQKATLISKLISTIHSTAPADLCCHITKNVETFSNLINVLIQNIHISGSLEILSTFISRTIPPESRYVFCELLAKLDFVDSLINVMTLSDVEDKQRNACQLLCDIIVYGRQEASEQQTQTGPPVQDMLAEQLESQEAVRQILSQMFLNNNNRSQNITQVVSNETIIHQREQTVIAEQSSDVKRRELIENGIKEIDLTNNNKQDISDQKEKEIHEIIDNEDLISNNKSDINDKDCETNNLKHSTNGQTLAITTTDSNSNASDADGTNVTAIICGMKVLRCLIEWHRPNNNNLSNDTVEKQETFVFQAMSRIQDAVEEYLGNFHELLLNPPRQEPIKTTFGVIQKPLGYIRLEVVNLIRALISVNSPKIIMKLVELRTMKVIIDLFIDYSWNNLLHTQVEQALCMIIKISRHDEDLFFADYWNKRLDELVAIAREQDEEKSKPAAQNQCNGTVVQNGQKCEQDTIEDSSATNKLKQRNKLKITQSQSQSQPQQPQQPKTELSNDELSECNDTTHQGRQDGGLEDESNGTSRISQTNGFRIPELSLVEDSINNEREKIEEDKQEKQQQQQQQQQQQDQHQQQHDQQQQQRQNHLPAKRKSSPHLASPTVFLAEKIEVPVTPSIALLHQILNDCDLIGRLLQCSNGEANFGHIIQIINSIAINCDLDTIKSHLKDIETKQPELFDRWTTFVTVDVASFKETSLYFDIHSPRPLITAGKNDALWVDPYLSFTREQVLPKINVDVIPLVVVGKKASKQG